MGFINKKYKSKNKSRIVNYIKRLKYKFDEYKSSIPKDRTFLKNNPSEIKKRAQMPIFPLLIFVTFIFFMIILIGIIEKLSNISNIFRIIFLTILVLSGIIILVIKLYTKYKNKLN